MWGHLKVSWISPDVNKTQSQPWIGHSWIAAVTQSDVRKQEGEKEETVQPSAKF